MTDFLKISLKFSKSWKDSILGIRDVWIEMAKVKSIRLIVICAVWHDPLRKGFGIGSIFFK